jgi:transcription antitermination factor NusG
MTEIGQQAWYAIQVRRNHERITATHLEDRGYETFLPLYKSRRRWSDRVKEIELPLFSGYLFCHMDPANRLAALTSPGVVRIVGIGKAPIAVEEREIDAVRAIVESKFQAEPYEFLQVGERVQIGQGPLRGLSGILLAVEDQHRLVVGVTLLKRSVAVSIEQDWAIPLDRADSRRCA